MSDDVKTGEPGRTFEECCDLHNAIVALDAVITRTSRPLVSRAAEQVVRGCLGVLREEFDRR